MKTVLYSTSGDWRGTWHKVTDREVVDGLVILVQENGNEAILRLRAGERIEFVRDDEEEK